MSQRNLGDEGDGSGAAFYHLSPWVSSPEPPNAAFNHSQGEEWKICQCYKLIKGLALQESFHYRDYEQPDLFQKRNVLMVIARPDDESVPLRDSLGHTPFQMIDQRETTRKRAGKEAQFKEIISLREIKILSHGIVVFLHISVRACLKSYVWVNDTNLLVCTIPAWQGSPPKKPLVPSGPKIHYRYLASPWSTSSSPYLDLVPWKYRKK
ncbi:hypothetical protein L1887_36626 [Cichorium endivia]|nr:hypothetical protein L1887_36626 [Cichorium endivia]